MDQRIDTIIDILEKSSKTKSSNIQIEQNIDILHQLASQYGLDTRQLQALVNIVASGALDTVNTVSLVKALFPREVFPERLVVKVLGVLTSKGDLAVKLGLLHWIIMVYDQIESKVNLKRLYGVFFHLLDHDILRHSTCHLLFLITSQEHVKHFRVHKLIELYHRVGPEPGLCSILDLYKSYCPELINIPTNVTKNVFKAPDIGWVECLLTIHLNNSSHATEHNLGFPMNLNNAKVEVESEQFNTVEDLIKELSLKEPPQQLSSILDNHLIQLLITSHPNEGILNRISAWAYNYLMNLAFWRDQTIATKFHLQELLGKICSAIPINKKLFPLFERFLASYLCYWDGITYQTEIFTMITHIPPKPFNELRGDFLLPLHKLYLISSETWKASLIDVYTCLLRNWSLSECSTPLYPNASMPEESHARINQVKRMSALANYIEKISVIGLEAEEDSIHLLHKVLEFYEEITTFSLECNIPLLHIPNHYIVCCSLFNVSLMPISRICGILARCKASYERQRDMRTSNGAFSIGYEREHVTQINTHIMDVCNCLWRGQTLNYVDPNSSGFGLDSETIQELDQLCGTLGLSLATTFGLTQSPAFLPLSLSYLRDLETKADVSIYHQGMISSASLRSLRQQESTLQISHSNFRVQYLDYLKENSCTGLYNFLYSTMTSLMNRKQVN